MRGDVERSPTARTRCGASWLEDRPPLGCRLAEGVRSLVARWSCPGHDGYQQDSRDFRGWSREGHDPVLTTVLQPRVVDHARMAVSRCPITGGSWSQTRPRVLFLE